MTNNPKGATYTGRAEKKRQAVQPIRKPAPTDVSGLIRCQLTGPHIYRETVVYIRPGNEEKARREYASRGEYLYVPGQQPTATITPVRHAPDPSKEIRVRQGTPIIDLNTGEYHLSASHAARTHRLSPQLITAVIRGDIRTAKGRSFRLATPAEIAAATLDPTWKFQAALVPVTPGKRK